MKRIRMAVLVMCVGVVVSTGNAAVLFESGTLGPTGVPYSDLTSGAVPSTSVDTFVYAGVRLHLNKPVITSQVGGHFVSPSSGTFFGAVVRLDDESDFPDSFDFSTSDLLGVTLLTFPSISDEVFGDLTLSLDPGWYALVFGSGLFGATGGGATVRNGTDLGDPAYIGLQPLSGFGWFNRTTTLNRRFVITGMIVPEPSCIVLILLGTAALFCRERFLRQALKQNSWLQNAAL